MNNHLFQAATPMLSANTKIMTRLMLILLTLPIASGCRVDESAKSNRLDSVELISEQRPRSNDAEVLVAPEASSLVELPGFDSERIADDNKASSSNARSGVEEVAYDQPSNLAELVASAEAIFVGEVGEVINHGRAYYFVTPTPPPGGEDYPLGVYQTWYKLWVRSIIKNDGTLTVDEYVVATYLGSPDIPLDGIGAGEGEFLYFATSSTRPEISTIQYGAPYGAYGRIIIDSAPVTFSDDGNPPVPFATSMTVQQFVNAVGTEAWSQATATITPYPSSTPDTTPDPPG